MATFVLIPGAGTDPRVFDFTIAELEARGHAALAPALPLDRPDATPSEHAEAITAAIAGCDDVVVAAHSLGAFSGTLAAGRLPARGLILLAPMIPAPGESAGEWGEATDHAGAIAELTARLGPPEAWDEAAVGEVFFHDVPAEVVAATAHLDGAPCPGLFGEPWPLEAWPAVPTRVLASREDRLFPLTFQRRVARERLGIAVDELPGGHLPMLARPAELADRLIALAGQRLAV